MTITPVLQILAGVLSIVGVWMKWRSNRVKENRLEALKEVQRAIHKADETNDTSDIERIINK